MALSKHILLRVHLYASVVLNPGQHTAVLNCLFMVTRDDSFLLDMEKLSVSGDCLPASLSVPIFVDLQQLKDNF